jgi:hypothetical protein
MNMNQKTQADSSAPIGCSAADGPQLPVNPARSADAIDWNPTVVRRGREVLLIFDTAEEALNAFNLLVDYDPNNPDSVHDGH